MIYRLLNESDINDILQFVEINKNDYLSKMNISKDDIVSYIAKKDLMTIGAFDEKLEGLVTLFQGKFIHLLMTSKQYQNIDIVLLEKISYFAMEKMIVKTEFSPVFKEFGFVLDNDEYVYSIKTQEKFQNYKEVQQFIASQKDRVYALENFQKFMNEVCQPQSLLKVVHIGGTNGKGSTTSYVQTVLDHAGYKVGTFTSPVLTSRLEVMQVARQAISEEDIVSYANRYMDLMLEYEISMFEIEVFIAILFFIHKKVDFALLEVGLGGELDATNIVFPILTANTNIGLDHTDFLGHSYADIAKAKAGIIKKGIPFITGEKKQECLDVFYEVCKQNNAPLIKTQVITNVVDTTDCVEFDYRQYHVVLNTSAKYQSKNSALAIEMLLYLREKKFVDFSDECLLEGLKRAVWAGRFEKVHENPLIIIDGAHNKEGIEAFCQSAKKYKDIKIIFSALKDKDTHTMIERLLEITDDVTVCEFDFYRAQDALSLAESFPVSVEKDWKKAVDDSLKHKGVVFVTGSLYFISEVRPYIMSLT